MGLDITWRCRDVEADPSPLSADDFERYSVSGLGERWLLNSLESPPPTAALEELEGWLLSWGCDNDNNLMKSHSTALVKYSYYRKGIFENL